MALAVTIGLGAELTWSLATGLTKLAQTGSLTPNFWTYAVVVAISAVCVLFGALSLPRGLAGANRLRVGEEGITLYYTSGRMDRFAWSRSRDRFDIHDYSEYPVWSHGRSYVMYIPFTRMPGRDRRTILTKEATEAILRRAQEQGARYSTYRGSAAWYGRSPVIHRVQGTPR